MIITKECDYALRIIRELADNQKKLVDSICNKEFIPRPYAYKILKKLEKAGIVKSYRGPSGGYMLSKDTGSFTLYDILIAIQDDAFLSECMKRGFQCIRDDPGQPCMVHQELCRIQKIMIAAFSEKSLAEIINTINTNESK